MCVIVNFKSLHMSINFWIFQKDYNQNDESNQLIMKWNEKSQFYIFQRVSRWVIDSKQTSESSTIS